MSYGTYLAICVLLSLGVGGAVSLLAFAGLRVRRALQHRAWQEWKRTDFDAHMEPRPIPVRARHRG
jgi:uncharacterized membrane protein